jgi:ribosome biogenesis protein Nip4
MKFRSLYPDEREIVRKVSKDYGLNVDTALKGKKLMTVTGGRREVFITNRQTAKLAEKIKKEPYTIGLFIGEIKRRRFDLGLEGATLIAPLAKKKVMVDEKAEQLVLYGRDVLSKSVIKGKELKAGDKCLIVNHHGEAIALGRVKKDKIFVENLKDRGWYLRKGE